MPIILDDLTETDEPEYWEKILLASKVYRSSIPNYEQIKQLIEDCDTYRLYAAIEYYLEVNPQNYHHIPNPSQTDINKHLKLLKNKK